MYTWKLLAVAALATLAAAAAGGPNPFTNTQFPAMAEGQSFNLTWQPTSSSTVTLLLEQGPQGNVKPVKTLACTFKQAIQAPGPCFIYDEVSLQKKNNIPELTLS